MEWSTDRWLSYRAKYIEGLENRLGRMESLLKLSGLLPDDPDGKTDLGDLERRLTEQSQGRASVSASVGRSSSESVRAHTPGSSDMHSCTNSPNSKERPEEEVENLSDMMCSLVTNNCGETRFIGARHWCWVSSSPAYQILSH